VNDVIVSLVQDTRVPSSQWSLDTCDGSGGSSNLSGYHLKIHKMQMAYIDFSWYGAGKIRFGFKGVDGNVFYVHEFTHNNFQDTAYIRSGNLPARYEVATPPSGLVNTKPSYVPKMMHWGTSVIMDGAPDVDKSFFFSVNGHILSFGNGGTIQIQGTFTTTQLYPKVDPANGASVSTYLLNVDNYNEIKNIRRGSQISSTDVLIPGTRIIAIQSLSLGGGIFIDTKPLVATSTTTQLTFDVGDSDATIPESIPLISCRLSPCVDSGFSASSVGERDVINRMQLKPLSVDILTSHDVEITFLLNGFPFSKSWQSASSPSLAQILYHDGNDRSSVTGGTQIFSFRAAGGPSDSTGRKSASHTTVEVSNLSPMGNSIVGGDDIFPNGPDVFTIAARLVDSTNITATTPFSVSARLSWTESQA
jgi:hypothetical protein